MLVGLLLLADSARAGVSVVAGIALVAGASALVLGVGVWDGGFARALRGAGWFAVVVVLCIPSTLTLLLLPVAPMVVLFDYVQPGAMSRERHEAQ